MEAVGEVAFPIHASLKCPFGVLTFGSSYLPWPSHPSKGQWPFATAFVADHSGGAVLDLHQLPSSACCEGRAQAPQRTPQHKQWGERMSSGWGNHPFRPERLILRNSPTIFGPNRGGIFVGGKGRGPLMLGIRKGDVLPGGRQHGGKPDQPGCDQPIGRNRLAGSSSRPASSGAAAERAKSTLPCCNTAPRERRCAACRRFWSRPRAHRPAHAAGNRERARVEDVAQPHRHVAQPLSAVAPGSQPGAVVLQGANIVAWIPHWTNTSMSAK